MPCPVSFIDKGKQISDDWDSIILLEKTCDFEEINKYFNELRQVDHHFDKEVSCLKVQKIKQKVIYSNVGELTDYEDVRCYATAASKGIERSILSGSKAPVLILPRLSEFEHATLATILGTNIIINILKFVTMFFFKSKLGALGTLYVPIQYRECFPKDYKKVEKIAFYQATEGQADGLYSKMIESGKNVARDIGGGDPERMTATAIFAYVSEVFINSSITVQSIIEPSVFMHDYPLFAAVNRCAATIPRHAGRIVFLEYRPPKPAAKTIILVIPCKLAEISN